jgi:hypothetical protein
MIKYVELNNVKYQVNMVTGTIRKPDGKFLTNEKELRKSIIKLIVEGGK